MSGYELDRSPDPQAGYVQIELSIQLYLFDLAAFLRRQVNPLGCRIL